MFYPPGPQYYPIAINEWTVPVLCPMYLQPMPVIVNPLLSTQICPYDPIVTTPVGTVPNEFPPAVPETNEYSFQMSEVSLVYTPNESPAYCDMSAIDGNISDCYSNYAVANELALLKTQLLNYSQLNGNLSNEISAPFSQEYSLAYDNIASQGTSMPEFISSVQITNENGPMCAAVSNEIPPTQCDYGTLSYFESELPVITEENSDVIKHGEPELVAGYPLEFYLSLPRDLFPTARMLTIDPNSIIDDFCKVPDIDDHSWILDLEFGVPKTPVKRRVAIYNAKFNSINCKNVPDAIHPGFEKCDKGLKRALIFYYDCVISNWYRGYMAIRTDASVENFQYWLLRPMQSLGMCWP